MTEIVHLSFNGSDLVIRDGLGGKYNYDEDILTRIGKGNVDLGLRKAISAVHRLHRERLPRKLLPGFTRAMDRELMAEADLVVGRLAKKF